MMIEDSEDLQITCKIIPITYFYSLQASTSRRPPHRPCPRPTAKERCPPRTRRRRRRSRRPPRRRAARTSTCRTTRGSLSTRRLLAVNQ